MTQKRLTDISISWLRSWIEWRNTYTEPGDKPFSQFDQEILNRTDEGCPLCKDKYVVRSRYNDGVIYCLCQILPWEERIKERYQFIRTPEVPASLDELELHPGLGKEGVKTLERTISAAEDFIRDPMERWLLITGPYGVGKTHILRSINTALEPVAIYLSAQDIEDLVHEYRKDDDLGDFYDLMRLAPILLIDDLGIEYGGPLFKSMIDRIIDGRIKRFPDKPTVIASNKPVDELTAYIERTGDRLMNLEKVRRTFIAAKSYRRISPSVR